MVLSVVFYHGVIVFALFALCKEGDLHVSADILELTQNKVNKGAHLKSLFSFSSFKNISFHIMLFDSSEIELPILLLTFV